jgi:hypothetical protein
MFLSVTELRMYILVSANPQTQTGKDTKLKILIQLKLKIQYVMLYTECHTFINSSVPLRRYQSEACFTAIRSNKQRIKAWIKKPIFKKAVRSQPFSLSLYLSTHRIDIDRRKEKASRNAWMHVFMWCLYLSLHAKCRNGKAALMPICLLLIATFHRIYAKNLLH